MTEYDEFTVSSHNTTIECIDITMKARIIFAVCSVELANDEIVQCILKQKQMLWDMVRSRREEVELAAFGLKLRHRTKQNFILTTPGISQAVSRLLCSGSQ